MRGGCAECGNDQKQRTECATLPADGGPIRLLGDFAIGRGGFPASCTWDPSGTMISYVAFRDGWMNVFAQPPGGGPERQITRFPRDTWPQLLRGAWSRDGRAAVIRGNPTSDVVLISSK